MHFWYGALMSHYENPQCPKPIRSNDPFFSRHRLDVSWKLLVGPVQDPRLLSRQATCIARYACKKTRGWMLETNFQSFWLGTIRGWPPASSWAARKTKANSQHFRNIHAWPAAGKKSRKRKDASCPFCSSFSQLNAEGCRWQQLRPEQALKFCRASALWCHLAPNLPVQRILPALPAQPLTSLIKATPKNSHSP